MYDRLKQILVMTFQADPDAVTPEATLADLGLDSLDLVELSMVLKSEWQVELTDDELAELSRLDAILDAYESRSTRL